MARLLVLLACARGAAGVMDALESRPQRCRRAEDYPT